MPSKFNALAGDVLAIRTKLNVGFVQSLLGILMVAVLMPVLLGVKVITKLLPPIVNELEGKVVTLNREALGPVKKIVLIFSVPVPAL